MSLLKPLFIITCYLVSVSFFDINFIPTDLIPIMELSSSIAILAFLFLLIVYQKGEIIKSNFKTEIFIILFTVILSMFGAYYFHGQSFVTTALAQRAMYLYFFYFLLLRLKPEPAFILKIIVYFGLITAIIYIIQTVIYPVKLIRSPIFMDRGTLRIFMPGIGYSVIAYFYFFNQYLKYTRPKDIIFCFVIFIIFILLGTRQVLVPVVLLTLVNLILSKKLKSKVIVLIVFVLVAIPTYFIFQNIFLNMFNLTKTQGADIESDIRMRAIRFFVNDFFPNSLSHFTGNGVPGGTSSYAAMVGYYMTEFGFFQSDVGIIGDYTQFGLIFVITTIVILLRMIFTRLPEDYKFLWYTIFTTVLTIFFGSLMSISDGIILLCSMLYLYDVSKYKKNILSE